RFQPVFVGEPSVENTIAILRGLKDRYEQHHGVRITDEALEAAAKLSNRYITNPFLPDKAIAPVNEAAARLKMEIDTKPEELDTVDREIERLKTVRAALRKEGASRDRVEGLEKDLSRLEKESAELTSRWKSEKNKLSDAQKLKTEIDRLRTEAANAQRAGDFERAGELTHS